MKEVLGVHEATSVEERKATWKYLDKIAYDKYKKRFPFWDFTDYELALLWAGCLITEEQPWGQAYDDEVYDEIYGRTYSDQIFSSARYYYEMGVTK